MKRVGPYFRELGGGIPGALLAEFLARVPGLLLARTDRGPAGCLHAAGQRSVRPMNLAEFLLARIAEDERWANECAKVFPGDWELSDRGWMAKVTADEPDFRIVSQIDQDQLPTGTVSWLGDALAHVARHDPARVLAECEAKRQIIGYLTSRDDYADQIMLQLLAAPYADHPDFHAEWSV
jgi:hypothetical protein